MCFFFTDTPPSEIYTLSLHDALPISVAPDAGWPQGHGRGGHDRRPRRDRQRRRGRRPRRRWRSRRGDRKSTRLNSSHTVISYAVFCLKKKIIYVESTVLV